MKYIKTKVGSNAFYSFSLQILFAGRFLKKQGSGCIPRNNCSITLMNAPWKASLTVRTLHSVSVFMGIQLEL